MRKRGTLFLAGILGGTMLVAAEQAVALNPPGGSGPMAPAANPPARSDEPDDERSRDRELDELDEMMRPSCGVNVNWQSTRCGQDVDEDEPSGSLVAPPTGSGGSSDVLPVIQERNQIDQSNEGGGEDWNFSGTARNENQNSNDQAIEQANECIGYECSSSTASQKITGSPTDVSGYFNADFTGRSDVPPKTPSGANADPSATQTLAGDRGGSASGETGYFNSDYTGRSDVPPKNQGGDPNREIPVNLELGPVVDLRNAGEPSPPNQACSGQFDPVMLDQQTNNCVNAPLVDHPAAEAQETDGPE